MAQDPSRRSKLPAGRPSASGPPRDRTRPLSPRLPFPCQSCFCGQSEVDPTRLTLARPGFRLPADTAVPAAAYHIIAAVAECCTQCSVDHRVREASSAADCDFDRIRRVHSGKWNIARAAHRARNGAGLGCKRDPIAIDYESFGVYCLILDKNIRGTYISRNQFQQIMLHFEFPIAISHLPALRGFFLSCNKPELCACTRKCRFDCVEEVCVDVFDL